jgi:prepilin-type N-terminal cleavage/methylation domain-containing protein
MVRGRQRPAFTMLEILMALAIGVLLMGALYFAVTVQMRSAQVGRNMMVQNTLARSLFRRIDNDLNATMNLTDPARWRNQFISSSLSSNTNNTSNGIFTTSTVILPPPSSLDQFAPSDEQHLNFYFGRFPREVYQGGQGDSNPSDNQVSDQVGLSDLRRISYYFVSGKGLMREEDAQATSDNAMNPNYPQEDANIIAPEVTNVQFSYFDGFNWQDSWDATQLSADQITPQGSPRAIKIMLEIQLPKDEFAADPKAAPKTRQYTHVIVIHSASGLTPMNTANMTIMSGAGTAP